MRILSIGNFTTGWDGSICDEEHIAKALEQMGHEVYRMQREDASVGTIHDYDNSFIDFVLVAQWDGYPAGAISEIGVGKMPLVYWAFDYQADGQEWHERLVKEADLYLSKRIADSKYKNWRWLSQDFAPEFLSLSPKINQPIDVLFTGSYLPWAHERNDTLRAIDANFNLVIHSINAWEGFKDVRGPVMDQGLIDLYAKSKINISIDHTLEAGYWSDRNAQIMTCGGFVLFRHIPLSEARFQDKVAYFYSIDDCLKKIKLYLDSSLKRDIISSQGHLYAKQNLMVKHRVRDLLTLVEEVL